MLISISGGSLGAAGWWVLLCAAAALPCAAQTVPAPAAELPVPVVDPLRLDTARDPILRSHADSRRAVRGSSRGGGGEPSCHPGVARAGRRGARGGRRSTRAAIALRGLAISSYRVISRAFSNDPENIIERSRADQRTDATAAVNYTLYDFGAGDARVVAAGARSRAAAETESDADRIALAAVAAWYDVFAFRALVAVGVAFNEDQRDLRRDVLTRVAAGASAQGDVAQVDAYIASADTRLAEFRRALSDAEARYTELIGAAPPANLERAPIPASVAGISREEALRAAITTPAARAARLAAEASSQDARAARADNLPQFGAGIDAGRYGVIETDRDYDIRARVSVRQRFFGGANARARQVAARARAADARAIRIRDEASRDAAIAWAAVQALGQQLTATEANYIASRLSRDVLIRRFANSRGTLFDVASVQNA